jgi:hypothetical protein
MDLALMPMKMRWRWHVSRSHLVVASGIQHFGKKNFFG